MLQPVRFLSILQTGYIVSSALTEIFVINGEDECMKRCVQDKSCQFLVCTKHNFSCIPGTEQQKIGDREIQIQRSWLVNKTYQSPILPQTTIPKQLRDTCVLYDKSCVRPGVFACHEASPEAKLTSSRMCIEMRRLRVLYMCWLTEGPVKISCRMVTAWELTDPTDKNRKKLPLKVSNEARLPKQFRRHKTLTICGTPIMNTEFGITLIRNSIFPLHFNPRFYIDAHGSQPKLFKKEIVFNYKSKYAWGYDPIFSKMFPFVLHTPFMLHISRNRGLYIVELDNYTWHFKDRFEIISPNKISLSRNELIVHQVSIL